MKDKQLTVIFAFFLGGIGIHRFYLGQYGRGVISLLFCWTFIPTIIGMIDAFIFATMPQTMFDEKYSIKEE